MFLDEIAKIWRCENIPLYGTLFQKHKSYFISKTQKDGGKKIIF